MIGAMQLRVTETDSPVGRLKLVVREDRLCGLSFEGGWGGLQRFIECRFGKAALRPVSDAGQVSGLLEAYFDGQLGALERIQVDAGGSPFQRRVWAELRRIAVGSTTSYSELARTIGQPTAARAVATANAQNPVAVVIPCHRVIQANGSISGYGGGLERKRWLLRHEGAILC